MPFVLDSLKNLRAPRWSIQVKPALMVLAGLVSMALAISLLMFSTANALFAEQAEAELSRQNQSLANEIDNLTAKASMATRC